jgi:septal ring factor EnvC (AmiA/AmiB activator)
LIKAAAARKASSAAEAGRPKELRVFDAAAAPMLHPPVAGAISTRFSAAETDKPSNGLAFAALPGAVVIAAFDGRIDYAARFRDLGLVLIIWHGGGYHTVLAGLDRIDAKPGEWVLAGEPVGAMPDTAKAASGTVLKFELRRDGEPIDPFPSLIDSGEPAGRDGAGQNRVRE